MKDYRGRQAVTAEQRAEQLLMHILIKKSIKLQNIYHIQKGLATRQNTAWLIFVQIMNFAYGMLDNDFRLSEILSGFVAFFKISAKIRPDLPLAGVL